jgi:response regulator RpfG family c-di-GMP phosphodiesterase
MIAVIYDEAKPKNKIKIGPTTAKSEELEAIRIIAGTDSYLSSLFSTDFQKWADRRIKDDFPIDLMDEFRGLEKLLTNYKGENEKANREIEYLQEQNKNQEETIKLLRADLERVQEAVREADRIRVEKFNEQSQYLYEERQKVARLENTVDCKDLEIIRLKARLFDLLTEEKA